MFQRGFKAQCERRSVEMRKRLGKNAIEPLPPRLVADYLNVVIWRIDQIEGVNAADLDQLIQHDSSSWSAFTLRLGNRDLIVFNTTQSAARINSVIMHEISHILLGHGLSDTMVTDEGHLVHGSFSQDDEDEANWLSGAMLLPRPVLLNIRKVGLSNSEARDQFGVSQQMLNWRFSVTGVDYQLANRR